MKQVVRRGLKEIAVEEVPDPIVPAHHVLIGPHYSLISSGTETASIHTEGVLKEVTQNPSHFATIWNAVQEHGPLRTLAEIRGKFRDLDVLGYSGAGIVLDKHPTVHDLEVGARVAYGGEGTGHAESVVTGRNLVARVPDEVPFDHASFATLGAIALNAVRTAQISIGETVVVIGLGLVGQLVAQLVRLQGGRVIAIDLLDERVALACRLGADHGMPGGADACQMVMERTDGRGADAVIIAAAAKSVGPCKQALEVCRDRGRIIVVGAVQMNFHWESMYLKEIQLFMSRAYGPGSYDPQYELQGRDYPISYVRWTENRNMEDFLRLLGNGDVKVEPLITHRFPLAQSPQGYETIMDPQTHSLAVVLRYPAADDESPQKVFQPQHLLRLHEAHIDGRIGIGLLGAGNLARWHHLPNIVKHTSCRLVGIHSQSPVRGKSYARRFRADYCVTDAEKLLSDAAIDAVIIVTRNQHHGSQSLAALRAGKHVFVEKPLAITYDECIELARAVRHSGRILTVGFNRRFAPFYQKIKDQLRQRSGPAVLNCRVNSPGISGDYWMANPEIGGAILGEACHFIDLMYWLLESEPIRVTAYSLPTGRKSPVGENNIVASFEFADGSIANLTYCTIGSRSSGGERVEVFAEGVGAITENFTQLHIKKSIVRRQRHWWPDKGYPAQMNDFLEAIREGRPPQVTVVDGVRATVGCLKLAESAQQRRPMPISLSEYLE